MNTSSIRLTEVGSPRGWVVVVVDPAEPWAAAELECHLQHAGLSTAAVTLASPVSPAEAAAHLQRVAARLRLESGSALPIHYSGVGRRAGIAMQAAHAGRAGSLLWRPEWRIRDTVPVAESPSMVVVHLDQGRAARRTARRMSRRMGSESRLAILWADVDPASVVGGWADAASNLTWPAPACLRTAGLPTAGRAPRLLRKLAFPGALAIGAGTMLLPAASAGASLTARAIPSVQRAGDSAVLAASSGTDGVSKRGSRFAGKRTAPIQRNGDVHSAATGSAALTDKAGMKWLVNTNVTFATSSSASGAVSDATFQNPVEATTLHGGQAMSSLTTGYFGYNGLCISVSNATGTCDTSSWDVYNQTGKAPTPVCNARQLDYPIETFGALDVSRKVYVPSDDHFARWLDTVTNTGKTALTTTLETSNDLASSTNTTITGSSSGAKTGTTADDWVTTFDNFTGSNTTSPQPRLGHVFEGPGARVAPSAVSFANGNHDPFWAYKVVIQPGQTISVVNFGVADATIAESEADSARLDALPPTATECLTSADLNNIVNFASHPNEGGFVTSTPDGKGYWLATTNGDVKAFGDATLHGNLVGLALNAPIVGIQSTPDGAGYWLVGADGGVFAFGDAKFLGSATPFKPATPIIGMADIPGGGGYWLIGTDGGVFSFGGARFHGSLAGIKLAAPIIDIEPTRDGGGYWMAGLDGGVFALGDAAYRGSLAGIQLAAPISGLAATPDGRGYWMVGLDGGVFALGDAGYHGNTETSMTNPPTIGLIVSPDGGGYELVRSDGASTSFGDYQP